MMKLVLLPALLLALGGGTTTVPVSPPTAVCELGSLQASGYAG